MNIDTVAIVQMLLTPVSAFPDLGHSAAASRFGALIAQWLTTDGSA